jgi:hypothetical protein
MMDNHKVPFSANWLFMQEKVMFRIVIDLIRHRDNQFAEAMRYIHSQHGANIEFIEVSFTMSDRLWCSGFRPRERRQSYYGMPGINLYGRVLTKAYHYIFYDERPDLTDVPCLETLLTENLGKRESFRFTAASVSDSFFRQGWSIEGGNIFYQTGATLGSLANQVDEHQLTLGQYRFVIFTASSNDSNLGFPEQDDSFRKFKRVIEPLRNHSTTKVVFNLGIDVPGWPHIRGYNEWLTEKIHHEMAADNFFIMDWTIPHFHNHFIGRDRSWDPYYFADDQRHPNHHGLLDMWRRFHTDIPAFRDLRLVQFKTTTDFYRIYQLDHPKCQGTLVETPYIPDDVYNQRRKKAKPGETNKDDPSTSRQDGPSTSRQEPVNVQRPVEAPPKRKKKRY